MNCYVAGTQFADFDVRDVKMGQRVFIEAGAYEGEDCLRVMDQSGARLGFIPRFLVPSLLSRNLSGAWISKTNLHAVPWKRVRITVRFSG